MGSRRISKEERIFFSEEEGKLRSWIMDVVGSGRQEQASGTCRRGGSCWAALDGTLVRGQMRNSDRGKNAKETKEREILGLERLGKL